MYPGALLQTIEPSWSNPLKQTSWTMALVVACKRSKIATTPWVDEKTGERSNEWPMPVAWHVLIVVDNRIRELILDDDDRNKSWMTI